MIDNKTIAKQLRKNINNISTQNTKLKASFHKNKFKELKTSRDYSDGIFRMLCEIFITPGSNDYFESYLDIDIETKEVLEFQCNCQKFQREEMYKDNPKPCDHIVASMYKLSEIIESGSPIFPDFSEVIKQRNEKKSLILLNGLSNVKENKKELVNLDLKLNRVTNDIYELSLKIGTNRLYVLKNIQDFIMSFDTGETINFGKQFTFNPKEHYFTDEDQRVIDFISEYVEMSIAIDNNSSNRYYGYGYGYYGSSSRKLVKSKDVTIVSTALKRLLNLAKHKKITINYDGIEKNVSIVEGNIPMSFSMKEDENGIHISNDSSLPESISSNNDVFIYEDKIYIPSKENCEKYLTFIKAFIDGEDAVFPQSKSEEVFTKVMPILKSISNNIDIDKSIEDKIEAEELSLEFYFDRDKKDVWCNVKAVYGNEKFDMIKGYTGKKYLIRNTVKEEDTIAFLEDHKFYINKDRFHFTGNEEELFNFLGDEIESFKELGEVYYSDRFKENKIYKSNAINASLFEKDGYLQFSFNMDNVDGKEFNDIIKAFKNKRKFYKLKNNSFIDLADTGVTDFLTILDNMLGDKKIKGNDIDISLNRAMYLNDNLEEKNLKFINGKEVVENIAKSFENLDKVDYTVPKELNAELRDYQITGFKWLKTISYYGFGGILADEMGLGKTVQTIAFLLSEKKKKSLIVTPTSLIYNWKNEFSRFAPTMKILVLHGLKEQRLEQMKDIKDYDVVLTTYGTLRNDFSEYKKLKFDYCIIDEGQNIKNPLSQSSEAVKDIRAKVKIALTGTPIENNLMELWSIFDFIMPGYLYNKTRFQREFIGAKDEEAITELKKLIKPFILRRLKKNVIEELPDKIEKKFFVEMSEEQKKVYAAFVNDIKEKMDSEDETDKITVFSYLTKLRQLCLDPSLLVEGYTGGSPKIDVALEIISENIENGNKVLLFSQFTSVLANIKEALDKNNIGYYYLDGGTKASSRIDLVDSFNNNKKKNVFLISLKAGGTGLNLTSANVVIHFDPWWNPAIEEQATDRAHRIGQKNVVEVIKLISQGTVEEKVITMQETKKELINQVMEGDFKEGSFLSSLSKEEIQGLFQLN